jgi:hypothetical protein
MMATATLRYIMRDPSTQFHKRGVAQPGSAPPWGGGGRRFKSSRPDQYRCSCSLSLAFGFVSPSAMIQKLIAVSAPRAGDFSLLVQRKVTKRKHARVAHRPNTGRFPVLLAPPGARQLVGRTIRGSTRTGARLTAPGGAAVLGSRHGIFNPPQTLTWNIYKPLTPPKGIPMPRIELGCSPPRMARPSIAAGPGVFARPVFEPESRILRPASWGARRDRREAQGAVAPSGACFFWVLFFARAKKSTSPAVREPQLQICGRRPLDICIPVPAGMTTLKCEYC